jgi:hypothetical protein
VFFLFFGRADWAGGVYGGVGVGGSFSQPPSLKLPRDFGVGLVWGGMASCDLCFRFSVFNLDFDLLFPRSPLSTTTRLDYLATRHLDKTCRSTYALGLRLSRRTSTRRLLGEQVIKQAAFEG